MSRITVFVEHESRGTLATVSGTADMDAAEILDKKLGAIVEDKPKVVVLEMSGLTYLNSLTISSLVKMQQGLKKAGGDLRIASPSPYAAAVFKSTKIDASLKVFATVDEAWAGKTAAAKA